KLVARGSGGRRHRAVRMDVSRSGFDAAYEYLRSMFPGQQREAMLVGLEFAGHHEATFGQGLKCRSSHPVAILPSVTKKRKEVKDNSPRKDDAKDAGQICKLIASGLFVEPIVLSETTAQLRVLATERHRLGVEETRLKNRLQAVLDTVWPELTTESKSSDDSVAFPGIDTPTVRAILRRWPLPGEFASARFASVEVVVKRVSR